MSLRYAELFAGAGGLSLGLDRAGLTPVFHAEIAEFPRRVLRHHWPDVPLYGDVTTLDGRQLVAAHGPLDLLSGGSPCQDLSVAGKRAGLAGARSGLFHEQARLWDETGATYFLWENVAGALSSNTGADFAVVLSTLVGAAVAVPQDGWRGGGVVAGPRAVAAWRLLDAQFMGVPQRRLRVFVLAARAGGCDPAEVLLEPEGVRRHPPARRETREGAAGDAARRADGTGAFAWDDECNATGDLSGPLLANEQGSGQRRRGVVAFDWQNSPSMGMECRSESSDSLRTNAVPAVLAFNAKQDGADADSTAPTLLAMPHDGSHANGGGQLAVVLFDEAQIASPGNRSNPQPGDPAHTLGGSNAARAVCLTGDVTHALTHEGYDAGEDGTGRGTPIVAFFDQQRQGVYGEGGVASTLAARDYKDATDLIVAGVPRRLLPVECERLMDWPDGWTAVPDETGKPASNAARYKACGNGVVSAQAEWIGRRLLAVHTAMVDELQRTEAVA